MCCRHGWRTVVGRRGGPSHRHTMGRGRGPPAARPAGGRARAGAFWGGTPGCGNHTGLCRRIQLGLGAGAGRASSAASPSATTRWQRCATVVRPTARAAVMALSGQPSAALRRIRARVPVRVACVHCAVGVRVARIHQVQNIGICRARGSKTGIPLVIAPGPWLVRRPQHAAAAPLEWPATRRSAG
jgi:hypothetical protein